MLSPSLISQIAQTNWIPLCHTSAVPAHRVRGIDLEYRKIGVCKTPDNKFRALDDRCPHRHGPLCGQRIRRDGTFACPYHGARFNVTSGECVDFLKEPSSLHLHEYETRVDQDSVLWCRLTDDAVPFPELPYDVGVDERAVRGTTDVPASAFDLVENLCDPIHIHQVHGFGNKKEPQPKNLRKIVVSPSSCGYTYDYKSSTLLTRAPDDVVHVLNGFHGPFSVYSNVAFASGFGLNSIRVSVLPLTPTTSRLFWTIGRNFMTGECGDFAARRIMEKTIAEDAEILAKMSDKKPGCRKQALTKFDWIIAKYRRCVTLNFLSEGQQ